MKRVAIFASGAGSNALKFLEYFDTIDEVEITLVVSNNPKAGVLHYAEVHGVSTLVMDRDYFCDTTSILEVLKSEQVDLIVLAGFLWLIPAYLIQAYPAAIVNIHPALLPSYGGKGMYGMNVHKAVKRAQETVSGITIHYVNEKYDEGKHIFQAKCIIDISDTPEMIASKVLQLEHEHYSQVVHRILT